MRCDATYFENFSNFVVSDSTLVVCKKISDTLTLRSSETIPPSPAYLQTKESGHPQDPYGEVVFLKHQGKWFATARMVFGIPKITDASSRRSISVESMTNNNPCDSS